MFVPYTHESIRLTGRWDQSSPLCAVTTTTGSYIEFCFEGNMAVARFDIEANMQPLLHLWVQIDGGDMTEATVDRYMRVCTTKSGLHTVRIIYKSGTEASARWYLPLTGKVTFLGVQTDNPVAIAPDNRPVIEFVGDSITEGVLIDVDFAKGGPLFTEIDALCRCYQDDVCATYAWLTAQKLNLRPVFMGYGAVGATRPGMGRVPDAPSAYPFNFENSPITHAPSDFVVINHGANDRRAAPEFYRECYEKLLDEVIKYNPRATVVALSAFCGGHKDVFAEMIPAYNQKNGTNVLFVNGSEWVPAEPLHPLRDGHQIIADNLAPILKDLFKL